VISQSPIAGTQVATGSAVALVVSSGPPQVAVPNVVGLTQAAATTAITGANLTVGAVTTASSTTVPSGSVISQSPIAGTQVVTGSAVALVVSSGSSGPSQVAVPNVVGLTQAAATTAITGANLTVGAVTTAFSSTVPAGSVLSESPIAGTQVAAGSAVALVVASNLPQVVVPDVVGLTQGIATSAITGANLEIGAITTASSTTVPTGSIISQSPAAGTQVTIGSTVTLVESSGPPEGGVVPPVIGLTQAAATTVIAAASLTVGTIAIAPSATMPAGCVMSQTPVAGEPIEPSSEVAIVVSSGPPPTVFAVDTTVFSDGFGTRVTNPFSTATAGELLVAFVASDGPGVIDPRQTATVSGAGLAWSLVTRANTQYGTAEIWTATAPTQLFNVTVTATQSLNGFSQSLTVMALTGAGGIGASAAGGGNRTAPSVSFAATASGSFVFGVGVDPERRLARTPDAGQTIVHQWVDLSGNNTYWVQTRSTPTPAAGSIVTISDAATNSRWNLAAVEIVAR
jgi:beta-lactam-binding protein with PASTA domain